MCRRAVTFALVLTVVLAGGLGFGTVTATGFDNPDAAGLDDSGATGLDGPGTTGETPPGTLAGDVLTDPDPSYPPISGVDPDYSPTQGIETTGSDTTSWETTDAGTASLEATESADGEFEVHILDVGQADAAVIFSPEGETMVIDSGGWQHEGEAVIDFLEAHDVDRVDHLIGTHAHADHIGGHAGIIEHFEEEGDGIGAVYDNGVPTTSNTYEEYMDAVEEYDVTLYEVQEGDEIQFAGVYAPVFNPPAWYSGDSLHYSSVTVLLEYGDTSFLFTGDAEEAAETRMADEHGEDLAATVFHAGHHGSSTSSHHVLLDEVEPEATAISSAYDSQFGHPDDDVLDRFGAHDICAYWTGTHGTNSFVSDGEEFTVYSQVDGTTDPGAIKDDEEAGLDPLVPTKQVGTVSSDGCEGTTHEEAIDVTPGESAVTAEHTWTLADHADDFDGEVDAITVEYPGGTSLDGLDQDDVTVKMDRDGDGTLDEIDVNADQYAGSEATFDLSGIFNTDVQGEIEVVIDGVENPPEGEYRSTITLQGEDTYGTDVNVFVEPSAVVDPDPDDAGSASEHTWTLADPDDDFDGEADTITVEYPDGTSFDGLDQDDVTVRMDRDGDGTLDEIDVNADQYAGSEATFDLSGIFNTDVQGEIEVVIDGVENPPEGDYSPTITLDGDDSYTETGELAVE